MQHGVQEKIKYAIIGGSGITGISDLIIEREMEIMTPFGPMSDKIKTGYFKGTKHKIAFLTRHGKGHVFTPSGIPQRANVWGLKSIGVERVIAISAVGSLKEEIEPTHMVVPSQIFDRTYGRVSSFFENGAVGHAPFADPFCTELSAFAYEKIKGLGIPVHRDETYVCIEGPQFSTRAESNFYRSIGAGVVGMTAVPEAKLFREAEICYAMIAMATDYDCWKEGEESVNVKMVIENAHKNGEAVQKILREIFADIPQETTCECSSSLMYALQTAPEMMDRRIYRNISLFIDKYLD